MKSIHTPLALVTCASAALAPIAAAQTIVVAPTAISLTDDDGSFGGANRTVQGSESSWFNGNGFEDAAAVDSVATGALLPTVLPNQAYGWDGGTNQARIRSGSPLVPAAELTLTLGDSFDLDGLILWNHGEGNANGNESQRSIGSFTISFSTDGGLTFSGAETLSNFAAGPQGGTNGAFVIEAQQRTFSSAVAGVNAVRFSDIQRVAGTPGSGTDLINFGEIRFTSTPIPEPSSFALLGLGALGLFARRRR